MQKYEWSDKFLLGIMELDEHHEHLVDLMNKSYDLLEKKAPAAKVEMILDELFDYANYHFAAEENWLKEHSYINLNDHLVEHDSFRRKVLDFQNEFYGGKSSHKIQLFTFLSDWLFNHIRVTDFEYAHALSTNHKGQSKHDS